MNQVSNIDGTPIVGGLLAKFTMSAGKNGAKSFPLENSACGIGSTRETVAVAEQPTYWLKVDNSKRQSKWRKVYFDDDE
jgi:hypothetical protein